LRLQISIQAFHDVALRRSAIESVACHLLRVSLPSIRVGADTDLILALIFVTKNIGDAGVCLGERDADAAGGDGEFESH